MDNRHSQPIPDEVLTQLQTKINEAQALLAPYVTSLTPSERHDIPKMGEKSLSFVEKAYDFAKQNPALCPSYLNMEDFRVDFGDARGLWTILNTVRQLEENIDDTETLAGSEAYQAALLFYSSVKIAAAQNVPGAKAVYEELRLRFPSARQKSADQK
ncbi:MAG: hypothetical protein QM751_01950 [Paludibacteraceae bacterium]